MHYGLTPKDTRKFAYEFAVVKNKTVPENWSVNKCTSYDWLKRQPQLTLQQPESTSLGCSTGFNKTTVQEFLITSKQDIM
ncbi:hypothetical protein J437_LFUL013131 [Ladona fulva]|uniref:Uncharacterized protein n=1 Tax=Ladona fulva TaxID=123851 RepID=A0A8K0KCS2_LADFU|nr:hypothetical protein J437_LFUL013131 [Ladona fulva]